MVQTRAGVSVLLVSKVRKKKLENMLLIFGNGTVQKFLIWVTDFFVAMCVPAVTIFPKFSVFFPSIKLFRASVRLEITGSITALGTSRKNASLGAFPVQLTFLYLCVYVSILTHQGHCTFSIGGVVLYIDSQGFKIQALGNFLLLFYSASKIPS